MHSAGVHVHLEFRWSSLVNLARLPACRKGARRTTTTAQSIPPSANSCASSIRHCLIPNMSGRFAFSKGLKEVRFLFCQTGEHSAATRSFLLRNYPAMKKDNPATPILIRDASGTLPKVYARFEFGKEKSQSLEGLSDQQIEETVSSLVKNSS